MVGCDCYCIVGNSLIHASQKTIFMPGHIKLAHRSNGISKFRRSNRIYLIGFFAWMQIFSCSSFLCQILQWTNLLCYVVHRLQSISWEIDSSWGPQTSYWGWKVQVVYGWNWRLIAKEVDCMFDVKISTISLSANKTFLVRHLLDDYNNGIVEVFNGE